MVAASSTRALVSWFFVENALEFKNDRSEVRDAKSINKTTDERVLYSIWTVGILPDSEIVMIPNWYDRSA